MGEQLTELDKLHDECGIYGVFAPGRDVAQLAFEGAYAQNHRGKLGGGIAVSNDGEITIVTDLGLIGDIFTEPVIAGLGEGTMALSHTRYSTQHELPRMYIKKALMPMWGGRKDNPFAMVFNGNIINTTELKGEYDLSGNPNMTDAMVVTASIGREVDDGTSVPEATVSVLRKCIGAYSIALMDRGSLYGIRDPNGIRPYVMGTLPGGGRVLASEHGALQASGARFEREIEPGEMVEINEDGVKSNNPFPADRVRQRMCLFEIVYFSRSDNDIMGYNVAQQRYLLGRALAQQHRFDADVVLGVPESGLPAAKGYAEALGIPYEPEGLKKIDASRSFQGLKQVDRDTTARRKLAVNESIVRGKRVVTIDDSKIRATQGKVVTRMLREAGAVEVYMGIASPRYEFPCVLGLDTGDRSTLVAPGRTDREICEIIGADDLAYLTVEGVRQALSEIADNLCWGCTTGEYPVEVPAELYS